MHQIVREKNVTHQDLTPQSFIKLDFLHIFLQSSLF